MTSRDFCFWLQGMFELSPNSEFKDGLPHWKVDQIRKHLNLVFTHEIDPSMGNTTHQNALNQIHNLPDHMNPNIPDSAFPGGVRPRC